MKKIIISIFTAVIALGAWAASFDGTISNSVEFMVASNTNTTKGAALSLVRPNGNAPESARIWASASGLNAGTTNAAKNATLIFRFETSHDGVLWDSPTNSGLILIVPLNGIVTNPVSATFNLGGARYIRQGQLENVALGITTNHFSGINFKY